MRDRLDAAEYGCVICYRLARIYPLYLLTLFFWAGYMLAIAPVYMGPNDNAYTFVLNLLLLHAWGLTDLVSWNQPSWSISAEFFAYLLFPFLLRPLARARTAIALCAVVAAAAAVYWNPHAWVIGQFVQAGWLERGVQFANGGSLLMWFWIFCLGVTLHRAVAPFRPPTWVGDALFLAGVGVFIHACTVPFSGPLMITASALVVVGLYSDRGLGRMVMGNRISHFLGEISYALYLSHLIFLPLLARYVAPLPLVMQVAAAIAVAAALHYGFDIWARKWLRGMWRQRRQAAPEASLPVPMPRHAEQRPR